MPNYDDFLYLYSSYVDVRNILSYDDINKNIAILKNRVESARSFTEKDEEIFYSLIQENWKRALLEISSFMINRINRRITRGQTFSDNLEEIAILKNKSQNKLLLDEYFEINENLEKIRNRIEEKIGAEKFNVWIALAGVGLGFVLGLLGGYLLKIWGVC
jgi:hypothetical protein